MNQPKIIRRKATQTPVVPSVDRHLLTSEEFKRLSDVPPEAEWFQNIDIARTRRAYEADLKDFIEFVGISEPKELRLIARAHILAWRKDLERRELASATIRRKLAAMSSLYDYLCDKNAVQNNPVDGVKRPSEGTNEGKTPAISDAQARKLLEAPDAETLKGKRDRAIVATFLFHGIRCEELCGLKVKDLTERRGVIHLKIHGKGAKIRYIPAHAAALERISDYLTACGHALEANTPLFRPVKNPTDGNLEKNLTSSAIYTHVIRKYALQVGITLKGFCVHSLRATAATNALEHEADIAKVQEWLGHSSISTTKLYDRRKTKPEESPTFKVSY